MRALNPPAAEYGSKKGFGAVLKTPPVTLEVKALNEGAPPARHPKLST